MKRILIVVTPENDIQPFVTLTKLCEFYKLPYHTLKKLGFPIEYKGYYIEKKEIKR